MDLPSVEEVTALMKDVLEDENLTDAKLKISAGSRKGDGYMAQIIQVDIEGTDKSFIIKRSPPSYDSPILQRAFHVETFFYEKVVPAFTKLQESPLDLVPKCYKSADGFLILENLKSKGYRMWNRKEQMDDEHVLQVLKLYGRLHAFSAALRQLDPEGFAQLVGDRRNFNLEESGENLEYYQVFINNVRKMKRLFSVGTELYSTAARLQDNVLKYFGRLRDAKGVCPVVSHGDTWCNNMMFKYGDSLEVVLYDFQMCSFTSPALDCSYFFYTAASKQMLDDHERYFRAYHESFSTHLSKFGLDVEEVYPYKSLMKEWRFFAVIGCLMSTLIFKAQLRESKVEEVHVVVGDADDFVERFSKDLGSEVEDEKLRNLAEHLHKNQLI